MTFTRYSFWEIFHWCPMKWFVNSLKMTNCGIKNNGSHCVISIFHRISVKSRRIQTPNKQVCWLPNLSCNLSIICVIKCWKEIIFSFFLVHFEEYGKNTISYVVELAYKSSAYLKIVLGKMGIGIGVDGNKKKTIKTDFHLSVLTILLFYAELLIRRSHLYVKQQHICAKS